jgi:hypothetical protein
MSARPTGSPKGAAKRSTGKTASAKAARKQTRPPPESTATTGRRPYPRATIEAATRIPFALKEKNGGNPWPPPELAAAIGLSPKNPNFFYMAAASRDFGFTEGSRDSDLISLTEFGRSYVYAASKEDEERLLREAILKVDIFQKVLEYWECQNFCVRGVFSLARDRASNCIEGMASPASSYTGLIHVPWFDQGTCSSVPTWHFVGIARRRGQIRRLRRDRSPRTAPLGGRAWRGPTI